MYYYFSKKFFHPIYKKKVSNSILKMIDYNSKILDLGCGNGLISKKFKNVIRTDLFKQKKVENFLQSNAINLPFKDKTFNTTICIDMLHHTTNIIKVLKEMKRVTRDFLIIKEHAFKNSKEKILIHLGDFLTNNIKCENFNHLHYNMWLDIFEELNLKIIEEPKQLKFGFFINEKMNPIWKLKILD